MQLPRPVIDALGPMETTTFTTDDGVDLAVQLFGNPEGPPVVVANGIGVRYFGLARQIEAVKQTHRVLCWDYRGMGDSQWVGEDRDVSMPRHAQDMVQLMDRFEMQRALLVGWSMGVQVSLELIRGWPERAAGMVGMLGTYGRPFRTGLPFPAGHLTEALFDYGRRNPPLAQLLLDIGTGFPEFTYWLLSTIQFIGRDVERDILDADIAGVGQVEKSLYMRTLLELATHDASDSLPSVPCPVLMICGDRDWVTPPRSGRFIASSVPNGRYREITGGTHFGLIEQPALVNRWIGQLLEEVLPG